MNKLTVNGVSDYNPRACSNCGTSDWAAKNDRYCTSCEKEWWRAWTATVCYEPNPLQKIADEVMENHNKASGPWACIFCNKHNCNDPFCWNK